LLHITCFLLLTTDIIFAIIVSMPRRKNTPSRIDWQEAKDIKKRIIHLTKVLDIEWVDTKRIFCFRSQHSKARAYARIWSLSRVWQLALDIKPAYVIEVLSERYDKLSFNEKDKVLLHEIAHIPKNFSGSLLPHIRRRGKRNFHDRVEEMYRNYVKTGKNIK
jgi:predicted metallopeptidase